MPIPSNPTPLAGVIGESADVLPIPAQDYTEPTQNGALNYATGWPAITALPLEAGGKAPRREYFNALARLLSSHIFFQQSGSLYPWSATLDYLSGAHVLGSDGKEYIAQKSSGPDVPDSSAVDPVGDQSGTWLEPGSVYAPLATTQRPGIVQVGGGLSVTAQGVLSATCLIQSRRNGLPVYVRQNGNDSNDGLTEATAVASISRAQAILHTLDFGNTSAQINVGEGTFDITNVLFTRVPLCQSFAILSGAGKGKTILTAGVPKPDNQGRIEPAANWQFKNLTLRGTAAGYQVLQVNNGNLVLKNVAVETTVTATVPLIVSSNRGTLALVGCSFSGTASHFVGADNVSLVYIKESTTFSGTVTMATVYAARNSLFLITEDGSVSGKVTGPRYQVVQNGVIFTRGGGPNYFPGTTAGTSATGGVYA